MGKSEKNYTGSCLRKVKYLKRVKNAAFMKINRLFRKINRPFRIVNNMLQKREQYALESCPFQKESLLG